MVIIREYCPAARTAVLHSDTYANSVEYVDGLVAMAQRDYPGLERRAVSVVVFSGDRRRGMTGIEFPAYAAPKDYTIISDLELRFN